MYEILTGKPKCSPKRVTRLSSSGGRLSCPGSQLSRPLSVNQSSLVSGCQSYPSLCECGNKLHRSLYLLCFGFPLQQFPSLQQDSLQRSDIVKGFLDRCNLPYKCCNLPPVECTNNHFQEKNELSIKSVI